MPNEFKVGEVAIITSVGRYHGSDCTILSELHSDYGKCPTSGRGSWAVCYDIETPDGKQWLALPHELRKKHPPARIREDLGEWELCPWKPSQVPVR